MTLTTNFKETVIELCKDPLYVKELQIQAQEAYEEGDKPTGDSLTESIRKASKGE